MQTDSSNRNVLVTGGTGFVGCNLVETLVSRGCHVTCLVRESSDTRLIRKLGARLVVGDMNNPESIREAVRGVRTVYHLAGLIKAAGRDQYLRVNQAGTRLLLDALAETAPDLTRFVHMSSLAAAGPSKGSQGLVEEDKPNPISWYGESKLLSEDEVLRFSNLFPVTILRPSAVYGPYDSETLLAFRMIKRGCLLTPGRLTRRFSLIHVHDLTAACIQAGERSTPSGSIYFISRPEIYTWEDIGRAIARELGKRYRQISFPRWLAEAVGSAGDAWVKLTGRAATLNSQKVKELLEESWICDSSRARAELQFKPEIDLDRGISETVRWYQGQGWL
ncbi:MAG TPA: NAD-dependent epimerase/dehydratase family protein [Acidobacteriota bacterium]|nr:NAD-dependent epimerase/dehydratase family protein [Acidobacteriota bacterium]